jgi:hypothetical protein
MDHIRTAIEDVTNRLHADLVAVLQNAFFYYCDVNKEDDRRREIVYRITKYIVEKVLVDRYLCSNDIVVAEQVAVSSICDIFNAILYFCRYIYLYIQEEQSVKIFDGIISSVYDSLLKHFPKHSDDLMYVRTSIDNIYSSNDLEFMYSISHYITKVLKIELHEMHICDKDANDPALDTIALMIKSLKLIEQQWSFIQNSITYIMCVLTVNYSSFDICKRIKHESLNAGATETPPNGTLLSKMEKVNPAKNSATIVSFSRHVKSYFNGIMCRHTVVGDPCPVVQCRFAHKMESARQSVPQEKTKLCTLEMKRDTQYGMENELLIQTPYNRCTAQCNACHIVSLIPVIKAKNKNRLLRIVYEPKRAEDIVYTKVKLDDTWSKHLDNDASTAEPQIKILVTILVANLFMNKFAKHVVLNVFE